RDLHPRVRRQRQMCIRDSNYPQLTNELTIASSAVTVTGNYHRIDSEADASADTLSTINGGYDGMRIILQSESNARDITIDTAGNIELAGSVSFVLTRVSDTIELIYNAEDAQWHELSRSDNQT
ncbi:MAG: hypothetical protein KUG64_10165, partial [Cycloclasticus sp.]|nr:hypothetical protein [Cycloclasticus sp.]